VVTRPVTTTTAVNVDAQAAAKVAAYVRQYGDEFLDGLEQGFTQNSELTCNSTIAAQGTGIVVHININEIDNVDQATKNQMQAAYDSMSGTFKQSLNQMQRSLPELESLTIYVCEKDGDLLATIYAAD
jgi:hypothetical protein